MNTVLRAFVGFLVVGWLGWMCFGSWPAALVMAALGAFYAMGEPKRPEPPDSGPRLYRDHFKDM